MIPLPPDHLSVTQLAKRWSIHPNTLLRWRKESKGPPHVAHFSRILYPLDGVIAYETTHRITPNQ
jgi:transposase-like protein